MEKAIKERRSSSLSAAPFIVQNASLPLNDRAAVGAFPSGAAECYACAAGGAHLCSFAIGEGGVFVESNSVFAANITDEIAFLEQRIDFGAHIFLGKTQLRGKFRYGVQMLLFDRSDQSDQRSR